MTEAEKRELEALKAKAEKDLTDDEKARLEALKKKEAEAEAEADSGDKDKTFSESYVKGLRAESAKYRTKAKEAEEKLAQFNEVDIEEYRRLKQEKADAVKAKLEEKGEWEKLREQLVEAHQNEKDAWEKEKAQMLENYQKLEGELANTILGHEIAVAAATAKAINPKTVELILQGLHMVKVEQTDEGKRIIKVLDTEGNGRIDPKTGEAMTVPQLLEEMKHSKDHAHLFAGGNVGAGSGTEYFGNTSIKNPWKKETLNLTLQGQILTKDPALAKRLMAEAGK